MSRKFCVSGYYGFDNFGDETILKVLVEQLKKFNSDYEITVFSSNPDKTKEIYNVNSVYSFNLKEILNEIKKCEVLISGGGSLLQDTTSCKSLIYYLFIICLAHFFRKKVIIFAQGIGPIKNKILSIITFFALKKCDYITVRDENSYNLLKNKKIKVDLCNDPVWNIDINSVESNKKIGVQLRSWDGLSDSVLLQFAKSINKYYGDREILILSLQNSYDEEICKKFNDILLKLNSNIKTKIILNTSNDKVIEDISSLDSLIAMRYHACLIAIKCGVKLLPYSYDIKVETLSRNFDLDYIKVDEPDLIESKMDFFSKKDIIYDKDLIQHYMFDFEKLRTKI